MHTQNTRDAGSTGIEQSPADTVGAAGREQARSYCFSWNSSCCVDYYCSSLELELSLAGFGKIITTSYVSKNG